MALAQPNPSPNASAPAAPHAPPDTWRLVWSPSAQGGAMFLLAAGLLLVGRDAAVQNPVARTAELRYRDAAQIDLNQATAADLQHLPGVGTALAGRIVAHRRQHGPFQNVDELRKVAGFGPATLERLRPWLRVQPSDDDRPLPAQAGATKPLLASATAKSKKATSWTGPPLDLNQATVEELQKLPGIGPKLSQRILDERNKRLFHSVDELRRVSGIGPKTLARLRPYVSVTPETKIADR